jgi:hypothetical protein
MRPFGTLLFTAMLAGTAAAQTAPPPPAIATPASDVSIHSFGDREKSCAEWTDSCRTCRRTEAGEQACSNIGPTCQPAAITCTRKTEPAAPQ